MSIDEALDAYLLQLEADGRSPHTIGQARRHVRLFAAWAACAGVSLDVSAIGASDVASFLVSRHARTRPDGRPKKASSVNALRSSLRAYFRFATAAGFTDADPTRLVRRARTQSAGPRAASRDDVDAVLDAMTADGSPTALRDRALVEVMIGLGLRVGAAVGLNVEDVDWRSATVTIRAKGDVSQELPVPSRVLDGFSAILNDRTTGPLFAATTGRRLTTRHVARRLRHWCDVAGVEPISPHALRHAFATSLYRRTADIGLVQAALGHRSIASTMVYARVSPDRLREAIAM